LFTGHYSFSFAGKAVAGKSGDQKNGKRIPLWLLFIAVQFMHYNFCRVHKSLRVTPAMEAGLTDHIWTLEELISLTSTK